jgi:uracil-DNA glycosylase
MQADLEGMVGGPARLQSAEPADWSVQAGWSDLMGGFWASAPGRSLTAFLQARLAAGAVVYPPRPLRALELTSPQAVRVVILGQDPYHGPGQAEGLAFSVAPGVRPPPSLRNLFVEIQRDLGTPPPVNGSLVHWAEQGVLLLNTSLTVEAEKPASHASRGWEVLTDNLIRHCADSGPPKVFLLWGAHAQKKSSLVDPARHLVLMANHPSPLSARRGPTPFIGCGHFGQTNHWLEAHGQKPVRW